MIRIMCELPPDVIGFEAIGKVTAQDYQAVMMPELEQVLGDGGRLRVIYYLGPRFEGFTAGAMFDDALVGVGHPRSWERIAVVADKEWIHKAFGLFGALVPAEARIFRKAEFDAAVSWVAAED